MEDGSNNESTGTWEHQSNDQLEQPADDTSSVEVNHDKVAIQNLVMEAMILLSAIKAWVT